MHTLLWSALALFVGFSPSIAAVGDPRPALPRHADAERYRVGVLAFQGLPDVRSTIGSTLSQSGRFQVLDFGSVDAAAVGGGYAGSLNLTTDEARTLAAAVGAEVLVLGLASAYERDASDGVYGDGFVALFLVDGRSGRLVRYRGIRTRAATRDDALRDAVAEAGRETAQWPERLAADRGESDKAASGDSIEAVDFIANPNGSTRQIPPRFFRRPKPAFTEDAERARVAATVEVVVEFRADATIGKIQILRWAGFGLDEAVEAAIRAEKFYPARLDDRFVNARALLRYNFRVRE